MDPDTHSSKLDWTGERLVDHESVTPDIILEHVQRYNFAKRFASGLRVIDIACGEGYGSRMLAETALSVRGYDIDDKAIKHANQAYATSNLHFEVGKCPNIPAETDSADMLVSFETLEHFEEHEAFLTEIRRVLTASGLCIISTPDEPIYNRWEKDPNPYHKRELNYSQFKEVIERQFTHVCIFRQSTILGSLMYADEANNQDSLRVNSGDFHHVAEDNKFSGGVYLVAIASNSPLPSFGADILENRNFLNQLVGSISECSRLRDHITELRSSIHHLENKAKLLQEDLDYHSSSHKNSPLALRSVYHRLKLYWSLLKECCSNKATESPTPRSLNGIQWRLDAPNKSSLFSRSSTDLHFYGKIRDIDGRTPDRIYANLGKRTIQAEIGDKDDLGYTHFDLKFKTTSGLKLFVFRAKLQSGTVITMEHRLLRCDKNAIPPLPPDTISRNFEEVAPKSIKFAACQSPLVSIVIPIYNQVQTTLRCLKSIARHTQNIDYEIIVIDDASPDSDVSLLSEVEGLRIHRNDKNLGFVLNCNLGANLSNGRYLMMLNNDTEVTKEWLEPLIKIFDENPEAGLVGSKLIYPDGRLQEAGGIVWRDGTAWNYGNQRNPRTANYGYVKEVDYCSGACILIEKELFDHLGGFDKRYVPAYYEDTDLAFKVREAGKKVYYQPKSQIVHYEGLSNGTSTSTGLKKHQIENQQKFYDRWKNTLERDQYPNGQSVFRARERGMHRPTILIIDHHLPRFDQDAGSLNIYHYLQALIAANFSVKFLPDNLDRLEPYLSKLQQMGIEVLFENQNFSTQNWIRENGKELDYVLLSRAHIAVKFVDLLKKHSPAKLLFYGHDLLSRTHERTYQVTGSPKAKEDSREWSNWENQVFDKVDAIFYPSAEEVRHISSENQLLTVAVLPPFLFPVTRSTPLLSVSDIKERKGILFVGGFGHTPNVDAMLWFCREVLPKVHKTLPDLHLTIAGSSPSEEIRNLANDRVTVTGYISDKALEKLYEERRLVIAPLRLGGGIKGKIIEALRHQIPLITTPVGAEGIPNAEKSMTVAEEGAFAEALVSVYQDIEGGIQHLENARILIEEHYSRNAFYKALAPHVLELKDA